VEYRYVIDHRVKEICQAMRDGFPRTRKLDVRGNVGAMVTLAILSAPEKVEELSCTILQTDQRIKRADLVVYFSCHQSNIDLPS
jgi:hypothetical protein